jgi:hypothetical protein
LTRGSPEWSLRSPAQNLYGRCVERRDRDDYADEEGARCRRSRGSPNPKLRVISARPQTALVTARADRFIGSSNLAERLPDWTNPTRCELLSDTLARCGGFHCCQWISVGRLPAAHFGRGSRRFGGFQAGCLHCPQAAGRFLSPRANADQPSALPGSPTISTADRRLAAKRLPALPRPAYGHRSGHRYSTCRNQPPASDPVPSAAAPSSAR